MGTAAVDFLKKAANDDGSQVAHLHADSHLQVSVGYGQASFQPMKPLDELSQLRELILAASEVCPTGRQKTQQSVKATSSFKVNCFNVGV